MHYLNKNTAELAQEVSVHVLTKSKSEPLSFHRARQLVLLFVVGVPPVLGGVRHLYKVLNFEPVIPVVLLYVLKAILKLQCGVCLIQPWPDIREGLCVLVGELLLWVPADDGGAVIGQHDPLLRS